MAPLDRGSQGVGPAISAHGRPWSNRWEENTQPASTRDRRDSWSHTCAQSTTSVSAECRQGVHFRCRDRHTTGATGHARWPTTPGDDLSDSREPQVVETFLTLTDTLVHDFDAVDLLTMLAERCVDLLDVHAAGVILTDGRGGLSVAAASSAATRLREVFAVAIDAGPCLDCLQTGEPVISEDLRSPGARERWPRYARRAEEAGFRATHALPMRLRGDVVGVLTLLHTDRHALLDDDARLGQALADATTIGLLHVHAPRRAATVQEQLQSTLDGRVVIEQAKGILAATADIEPEDAFNLLRRHAHSNGVRLTDLARHVAQQTTTVPVDPEAVRARSRVQVSLTDGTRVLVRPIEPDDADALAAGFQQLSVTSAYRRFFTTYPRLSPQQVRYFTDVDHSDHEAVAALTAETDDGIGVARYIRDPDDPHSAELAIVILDEWHRRGLGYQLMRVLCDRARDEGITTLHAEVLTDNPALPALLRRFGTVHVHTSGPTSHATLDLGE